MPDSRQNQTNLPPNTSHPVYSPQHIGQNLQDNSAVVGAYGQYGTKQGVVNPATPPAHHGVDLAGLQSQRSKNMAATFTHVPQIQQLNPQGSNLAHPSGPGSYPQQNPPQNLSQSPQTYINNSVNQYRRPVAPPQNRAQLMNSQQVFPMNQSPYAKGGVVQGQRPNTTNQPVPQKKGLFSSLLRSPQPQQKPLSQQRPVDKNSVEYLRKLSPAELRKEVIDTEIEIQKTLIASEKAYREGVTTIRDLIAPSSLKVTSGSLEIGTKMIRTFFVLTYPRIINSGWLEGVVNADVPMDLSIFIYPRDSTEVLRELKSKVGKIQASLQLNSEKGAARDPQLETAYRDVEGLRDAIQQGVEKFFKVGVYISIYADNVDQLEKYSQTVESVLAQQSIIMKRAALQMDDGFNSSLPILKDDLDVLNNMNTSPLSASFPFVSSELSSNDGILYGVNRHNNSLIIFDRFDLENANSLIFATSGAGKSYTVKLEILRSLMLGVSVIVIDPEQEYKLLCDKLGGVYINFSLNSVNRINPFDLPKALPGESTGDILRSAIVDLMGLMNLMLGKLTPTEESIMERAIKESYAKRDITDNADLNTVVSPTMSDLVEILEGIVGGESLAQRLYKYTDGTFAGIFNQRSNIDINNNFVVFNIRDLQETLRPIAMYVLLKFIWNEIRSKLKKRIVAVDEAWIMMQYEDSARFLYGLVKRARKYYLGVTTITQDVGDFLNSPFGKPIVTNAAMKILLKQSSAAIDTIADTFALTSGEKQVLLQSEVGQGIFFAGPRHVAIDIIAFPREHMIITTNPKELLKQQGLDEAGDAITI
jgi:conjugal transfer ATP-binding protein TraC